MLKDKKQIYIVDDDESVCRALRILLATYGFTVKTFSSAEEFFCAVPNSVPGRLILDIHMPGMDGWEALKRIIKSGSKRRVIIISAEKSGGLRAQALKAGAAGFLQKPFNDQALVDLISIAVEKKKRYEDQEVMGDNKKEIVMNMCGYHLRCLNYGNSCSDCGHQYKNKNKDYLHDVLRLWPKGKEAIYLVEPARSQRVDIMPLHGDSDQSEEATEQVQTS